MVSNNHGSSNGEIVPSHPVRELARLLREKLPSDLFNLYEHQRAHQNRIENAIRNAIADREMSDDEKEEHNRMMTRHAEMMVPRYVTDGAEVAREASFWSEQMLIPDDPVAEIGRAVMKRHERIAKETGEVQQVLRRLSDLSAGLAQHLSYGRENPGQLETKFRAFLRDVVRDVGVAEEQAHPKAETDFSSAVQRAHRAWRRSSSEGLQFADMFDTTSLAPNAPLGGRSADENGDGRHISDGASGGHLPPLPASYFYEMYGLADDTLRAAQRAGRINGIKPEGRWLYYEDDKFRLAFGAAIAAAESEKRKEAEQRGIRPKGERRQ